MVYFFAFRRFNALNLCRKFILEVLALMLLNTSVQASYKSFELRAASNAESANGETDFKGPTAVFSTDDRIRFLNDYATFASQYFEDPELNDKAVSEEEVTKFLKNLKPQPLPEVRTVLNLNSGWKKMPIPCENIERQSPLRHQAGINLCDGWIRLPAGQHNVVGFHQVQAACFECSWQIRPTTNQIVLKWGGRILPFPAATNGSWNTYRMQIDRNEKKAVLSFNGHQVAVVDYPGQGETISVETAKPIEVTSIVLIDYLSNKDKSLVQDGEMTLRSLSETRPYVARVLIDDSFRAPISRNSWQSENYNDQNWLLTDLPCVQGGFREADQNLYLRKMVDLPQIPERVILEMESVDPSGDLWVNGQHVIRFNDRDPKWLDITPYVKTGKNMLALLVDSRRITELVSHSSFDDSLGWFCGRMRLHLVPGRQLICRTLVSTQQWNPKLGTAIQHHRVRLDNQSDSSFDGTLEVRYSPWFPMEEGLTVQQHLPVTLAKNFESELEFDMVLPEAQVWRPDSPQLYKVHLLLKNASGHVCDDFVTTTGVRTIAQKHGKLLLNGQETILIGGQTMGFRPAPFIENSAKYNRCGTERMLMTELLTIKKMGGNLLRIHNHIANTGPDGCGDPRIAEMADQLGVALFWALPGWIRQGDERKADVLQMCKHIQALYNHPAILNWEASNHPNAFPKKQGPSRTNDFVRRVVRTILQFDQSRLITPTTYWGWTDYANDLGTKDREGQTIKAVPEYTHPLVTRGAQDSMTGYGREWSNLRLWPYGMAQSTLDNKIRAWMNFEHEESAAQPNWNLSLGFPWHKVRSYEASYEKGSIGRQLSTDEWRTSQAWQAFSAYESMKKQLAYGVAAFSWCTIEGGANSGTYEKPLLDPMGHAKLAWHIHKLVSQPLFAGSDNVDVVYGPGDSIVPVVFSKGKLCSVRLSLKVKSLTGQVVDSYTFNRIKIDAGVRTTKLPAVRPKFPAEGNYIIEYEVQKLQD